MSTLTENERSALHELRVMNTPEPASWTVRRASTADIPGLLALRRELFQSMGWQGESELAAMESACRRYFESAIPDGRFHGWVAESDGRPVATAGLVVHEVPPTARNPSGREGYVMNMFTRPEWRRRGIARALLHAVLDFLREQGIAQVSLHATADGRPLYEQAGFADSHEMRFRLDPEPRKE
jgi:GNAT superfamily N-acetyltransferase